MSDSKVQSLLLNQNIKTFQPSLANFKDKRAALFDIARIAEAADRYEDMSRYMRQLVVEAVSSDKPELTIDERNLLSVAYKNIVGKRRASHRVLIQEKEQAQSQKDTDIAHYPDVVEKELDLICQDVLDLLETHLIGKAKDKNAKDQVFYLKMAGDYYRYRAESSSDQELKNKAGNYYGQAMEIAKGTMDATDPIRLGLALNYSVCFYEILKDSEKACELAKEAFDDAISKLDQLQENDYKDATLIMQLLRDNLTLWSTNEPEDNEG